MTKKIRMNKFLFPLDLDTLLLVITIIFSIGLIIFLKLSTNRLLYILMGILILISCLFWIFLKRGASLNIINLESRSIFFLLIALFFLFLACSILSVYHRTNLYERPLIYFVILSIMVGIVALEILFVHSNNGKQAALIIFQIFIINLSLIWSQYLIFPNVIGIDPWGHQMITLKILDSGFIPQGYSYSNLALTHLETASTSLITGLDYKLAVTFSVTLSQIICCILFIFLLGKFLFNTKVALLASLLLVIGNYYIYMGLIAIPNAFAAIFIPIIIYLLFSITKKNFLIGTALVIFFMITLILTHTISAMCMAIILAAILLTSYGYNKIYKGHMEKSVTFNLVAFFSVAMFSWWIYATGHIKTLTDIIKVGFSEDIIINVPKEIIGYVATTPFFEQLYNQLGTFLFFSISILGCFYMISKKYGNSSTLNFAIVGLIPLTIGFFSLIFGLFTIPERWWYFSQILLVIPVSLGFILLYNKIKNKYTKPLFLLFLTIFFSFIIITGSMANVDNHMFSPNTGVRLALTESEITGAVFFSEKSVKPLLLDHDYSIILTNYYSLNDKRVKSLDSSLLTGEFSPGGGTIVIREEIVNRPFRLFGQPFKLNYDPKQVLENQGFSKIYDSNSVFGFYRLSSVLQGIENG